MNRIIGVSENPSTGKYEVNPNTSVEANKTVTIDVSSYTTPVEVTPSSPDVAMLKTTVTLSNIPSGGSDIETYGVISYITEPDWTHIEGIAFLPSDKTQEGYALMNNSSGWERMTATWNEDFTKIVINGFLYNFALIDSSFFQN